MLSPLFAFVIVQFLTFGPGVVGSFAQSSPKCRTQPADPGFPNKQQFSQLNSSIDGRLVAVVPSAQFCKNRAGGCPESEWEDSTFRSNIPGAMLEANWEQDSASYPQSLCFRNSITCDQGSVPIYAVNATSAAHSIQVSRRSALCSIHNLRVAIKASGHDYLGRSTAKNSLLLWTRYFGNITFHDLFRVGGKGIGSAVTAGSGVGLHMLYQACKAKGKNFVGGLAANVVAAGGYVQGAGHSPIGTLYGLAADNVLEFQIITANGSLITVNEAINPDLFWALRGGGAGSWGVIISATFRTFPTFNVASHSAFIAVDSTTEIGQLVTLHAQHIFEAAAAQGLSISSSINLTNVNDAISIDTDLGGFNAILGSRMLPSDVYRDNATEIGAAYKKLLDSNASAISEHLVAGGQVSENANISSAVHPKWRTAKTQILIGVSWEDMTPADEVEAMREGLTQNKVPILEAVAGIESASYSNEADVREPKFQETFFGDYARLSAVKEAYDPKALFIVGAGVGSENWDAEGLCRVA